MAMAQSEAKVIVALHIGSDRSRFAHAHKSRPDSVASANLLLSAIYYEPGDAATAEVKSSGFGALRDHESAVKLKRQRPFEMSEVGTYFGSFHNARESSTALLQKGFTITQVISDYLRLMGAFIVSTLQRHYGNDVSMNDVEWCVVLAHDWGGHAMELMRTSMERAGLVQSAISRGGSPYPLRFVPELDAASYHCLRGPGGSPIRVGDKLLVADLSCKSCHVSVQELHQVERSKFEVKQVAESVWDLGGRKQCDEVFMELLMAKMLPVQDNALKVYAFKQFLESHFMDPGVRLWFTETKPSWLGYAYELPINAQNRWKELDVEQGNPIRNSYDVIMVSFKEFHTAIKPYLDKCVALIAPQLLSTPDIKAFLLAGDKSTLISFSKTIFKDLRTVFSATSVFSASEGSVAMVQGQVLPFMWKRRGKLSKNAPTASSSHGDGIPERTISPKVCEVPSGSGSTSPSFQCSNVLSGGEGSKPSLGSKPSNSRVEGVVKKYSWDQVLQMTNGLTSKMLGKGGFGTVYLGKFENGKEVAVKVLNQTSQEDKLETFVNEVNLLIQVNHVNLVKLLGYCQDERNVVIYEYAEEGSIGDHLHVNEGDKTRLNDWKQRLSIMLQAAYGLDYLHSQCNPTIIHRDIKSENILLTKNMVAKVGDFGISKLMGVDDVDMKTHLTTKVIGSLWYIDPEYQETGEVRQASDVYSFGIVLLEMISGRKPCGIGGWVIKSYGSGGGGAIKAIADSSLNGNYNRKAMKLVIELAISCIDANGTSRPMMGEVVGELRKAQSIEKEEKKKSWFSFVR